MKIKRDSQNARILLHLAQGKSLTRYEAILMFRVQNITARMSEVRKVLGRLCDSGYNVYEGDVKITEKRDPNGQKYAEYRIKSRDARVALGKYLSSLRRRAA